MRRAPWPGLVHLRVGAGQVSSAPGDGALVEDIPGYNITLSIADGGLGVRSPDCKWRDNEGQRRWFGEAWAANERTAEVLSRANPQSLALGRGRVLAVVALVAVVEAVVRGDRSQYERREDRIDLRDPSQRTRLSVDINPGTFINIHQSTCPALHHPRQPRTPTSPTPICRRRRCPVTDPATTCIHALPATAVLLETCSASDEDAGGTVDRQSLALTARSRRNAC